MNDLNQEKRKKRKKNGSKSKEGVKKEINASK